MRGDNLRRAADKLDQRANVSTSSPSVIEGLRNMAQLSREAADILDEADERNAHAHEKTL